MGNIAKGNQILGIALFKLLLMLLVALDVLFHVG